MLLNTLISALEKRVNSKMIIFANYIKLFKMVNIQTDRDDRDEITYYYADIGMSSENISSVPSCASKSCVLGRMG